MMTDPISDMLTRIRNAGTARHTETVCPSSRQKLAVARVLKEAGFIADARVEARGGHPVLVLGVSKPGRRVYVGKDAVPRVRNGLGIAVLSTSKGILSDRAAREASVGGEVVCEVW
jgi:small subunit ribosomal protein S8